MTSIQRSALLPYPVARVYALVNDIEAYPEYMDGCVGAEVLRLEPGVMEARLCLARAGIRQCFSTRNLLRENEEIELRLLEGPFENFSGRWQFKQLGEVACKVSLQLDFSLNSSVLGAAAARLFDEVSNNMVDAIERRARQLYG